ncbi:unnamed protein product [Chrysoparadoxa australica]
MKLIALAALLAAADAFITPTSFVGSALATQHHKGAVLSMAASAEEYSSCKAALAELIDKTNSHPIMVRLAWHDSGTYDKNIPLDKFPDCGGANGSIRFSPEIGHGANAGLQTALNILEPVKKKFPNVGWADLMQMASATAVEIAGGPKIDMVYGRVDATGPEQCAPEGRLPDAEPPFGDGKPTPQDHLRNVFYRMGFDDQGIVALSGAHTLGRAFADRSGLGKEETKFTDGKAVARGDGKAGIGRKGGQPWTRVWLKFDNSYFSSIPDDDDEDLLKLSTDKALFDEAGFKPYALEYKNDQDKFFADYAVAHKKLAELGCKFEAEVKI